jgi:hypothetical protein
MRRLPGRFSLSDIPDDRRELLAALIILACGFLLLGKLFYLIKTSGIEDMRSNWFAHHEKLDARALAMSAGVAEMIFTILAIGVFCAFVIVITREIMNRLGKLGVTPPSRIMIGTVLLMAGMLCILQFSVLELFYNMKKFDLDAPDVISEIGPFLWGLYILGGLFFIFAAVMLNRGIRAACMSARVPAPRKLDWVLKTSYITFAAAALCSIIIASRYFVISFRRTFMPDFWAAPLLDVLIIAGMVLIPLLSYLSVSTIPVRKEPALALRKKITA